MVSGSSKLENVISDAVAKVTSLLFIGRAGNHTTFASQGNSSQPPTTPSRTDDGQVKKLFNSLMGKAAALWVITDEIWELLPHNQYPQATFRMYRKMGCLAIANCLHAWEIISFWGTIALVDGKYLWGVVRRLHLN
jgi:hypothetical protein